VNNLERAKEELLSCVVLMETPPIEILEALADGLSRQVLNQKKLLKNKAVPRLTKAFEVSHDLKKIEVSKTYINGLGLEADEKGRELTYDRTEEN
jgi:hypoxanthine-guanine phosphoribosyltransferase